jgi:hypothetical protein
MYSNRELLHINIKLLAFLCFVFSGELNAFARETGSLQRKDSSAVYNDTLLVPKSASLQYTPSFALVKKHYKTSDLYDQIKQAADKEYWTRQLHNIVVKPSSVPVSDTLKNENSEASFEKYKNKIIRNITLKRLNIFGPSVYDTTSRPLNWVETTGNKLHVETSDRIIYNHILFKKGDQLNPLKLSDNERVLRSLSFIEDARILVQDNSSTSDSVDILVIAKDVFPLGFDIAVKKGGSGKLQIWNKNLLGLGRENQNDIYWSKDKKFFSGFDETYIINNIAGTFINSNLQYTHTNDTRYIGVNTTRDFFTPNTKYAGGININYTSTVAALFLPDSSDTAHISYNSYDFWLGRSFSLKSDNLLAKHNLKIITAARFLINDFFRRPEVSETLFYKYQNKNTILGSIGLSRQNYYKTNMIYNFGRTEDIPYGFLLKATGGFERNEFTRRFYSSLSFSAGGLIDAIGYGYFDVEGGGFYNKKAFQQGMIKINSYYFTNLYLINRFRIRNFVNIYYVDGIKRFRDEYLTIDNNNSNGIQGLYATKLTGQQKININLEAVAFSPYKLYGFRFAFFSFLDLGMVGPNTKWVFNNPLYSSIGLGVRIKNERLVFKTIQIRLAYFPNPPKGALKDFVYLSGEDTFNPSNFFMKEPDLLQFQ